ncbi:MAG: glutamate racemase [Flammeovirgaceae bacterium]
MTLDANAPIGIFDSGIGGLTVAKAINEALPNERLIYFGDTAHLPYGDKSEAAIQAFSIKIADVLLDKGCKAIVIACNSASSAAYLLLKEYIRHQAIVMNVIDPMVAWVGQEFNYKKVGLIGTKRTVQSNAYGERFQRQYPHIELHSLATPLLAPMIEEGFCNNKISHDVIWQYLATPQLASIQALILACTHYPLIKAEIENFYQPPIAVLDSSRVVAQQLQLLLVQSNLLRTETVPPHHQFLVSDFTEAFASSAEVFFRGKVRLELHRLWN